MALLSFAGTAGWLWWVAPVENALRGQQEHRGASLERFVSNLIKPEQPLSASFNGKEQINVLLVGLDHIPGRRGERDFRRSDSVLLASADFETRQIRIVSIPRDGWVKQKNKRGNIVHDKLAHSYVHGQEQDQNDPEAGVRNVSDAVARLLDVQPDYYVVIQFEGLAALVDALGGMEIDVEKRMYYRDRAGGLLIDFKKGPQHMTGEQVVQYARFRHDALGDIGRMERQQRVIKLVIEEIKKPQNLAKAPALISALHQAVVTNFTLDQLLAFVRKMDEYKADGIQTMTLQSYGNHEAGFENLAVGAGGMSVQVMTNKDIAEARQFLQDLSVPLPPDPEVQIPPLEDS
jgi:LCP family protein required for cell wall assembly